MILIAVLWGLCIIPIQAATVAYWRFEEGPANAVVPHSTPDGQYSLGSGDTSGNGNHLSAWTQGGATGEVFRAFSPAARIPLTGAANQYSLQNGGDLPALFTASASSRPTGIDLQKWTPAQWTIEVSFRVDTISSHHTMVGRDGTGVAAENSQLAALYFQVVPDGRVAIKYADLDRQWHQAFSPQPILLNTWYHAAAVSTGSVLKLYLNGVQVASVNLGTGNTALAKSSDQSAWSIFRGLYNGAHTDRFYGNIDEIRISNTALPVSQFAYIAMADGFPDINGDLFVDSADLLSLASRWMNACTWPQSCASADADQSGRVDLADLTVLSRNWNTSPVLGLAGMWRLDEGTGTVVNDVLKANNGTVYNIEANDWEPLNAGFAIGLDAQTESGQPPEWIRLPRVVQDDFTLALWLRTTNTADTGTQWWSGKGIIDADVAGLTNDFGLSLLGNLAAFGVGSTDAGEVTIQSTQAINDGRWHHIAATRSSSTGRMELYIDGNRQAEGIGSTGRKDAAVRMLVGSLNRADGHYLSGSFDEIRAYSRVLAPAEIKNLAAVKHPRVTGKKGYAGTPAANNPLKVAWYYNWGRGAGGKPEGVEFVPMQWGKWWPDVPSITSELTSLKESGIANYALGFNEPDNSSQADTPVATAIDIWPSLMATGLPLISPACVHAESQWMKDFMAEIGAHGYRVDAIAIHWYGNNNPDDFIGYISWIHDMYGLPVWITEFAPADWSAGGSTPNRYSRESVYTFMAEVLWQMEELDFVQRYAWFTDVPNDYTALGTSSLFESDWSTLTPLGRLYSAFDGNIDGPDPETPYYLNHRSSHQRLRNPSDTRDVTVGAITFLGDYAKWKLTEVGDSSYFIENIGGAGRLSNPSGTDQVVLVANTDAGLQSQWNLTAAGAGWYFIDNRASGQRLHYRSDWGRVSLIDPVWTDGNLKWRFIKP